MHQNESHLFKNQSSKSLLKYRSENIEQRVMRIGKDFLQPNIPKNDRRVSSRPQTTSLSQEEKDETLQRKIRMLEFELKKKLTDDSLLRNIFKAKNSHEISRIDMYLQFRTLEDKYNELLKKEQESSALVRQMEQQMRSQQEKHIDDINKLRDVFEDKWSKDTTYLKDQVKVYRQNCQNNQLLNQQLRKKNMELVAKIKHMGKEISIQRESSNLTFIKFRAEAQSEIEQLRSQFREAETQLNEISEDNAKLESHLERSNLALEEMTDKNEKYELKVRELDEMIKDMVGQEQKNHCEEKEKVLNENERIRNESQTAINKLISEKEVSLEKERKINEDRINRLEKQHEAALRRERNSWKLEWESLKADGEEKQKQDRTDLSNLNQKLNETITEYQRISSQLSTVKINEVQSGYKLSEMQAQVMKLRSDLQQQVEAKRQIEAQLNQCLLQKSELAANVYKIKFQLLEQTNYSEKLQSKMENLKEKSQNQLLQLQLKRAQEQNQQFQIRQLRRAKEFEELKRAKDFEQLKRAKEFEQLKRARQFQQLKKAAELTHQVNDTCENENVDRQNFAGRWKEEQEFLPTKFMARSKEHRDHRRQRGFKENREQRRQRIHTRQSSRKDVSQDEIRIKCFR